MDVWRGRSRVGSDRFEAESGGSARVDLSSESKMVVPLCRRALWPAITLQSQAGDREPAYLGCPSTPIPVKFNKNHYPSFRSSLWRPAL